MKYQYDVTVVVPVYNAQEYLSECLESLVHQTIGFSKIEVLLINDGSTDGSITICEAYQKQYKNIRIFDNTNHGVSYSRNQGIKNAKGKYIMMLDSDDFLTTDSILNLYNFFEQHEKEVDLVTYPLIYFYKSGKQELSKKYRNYDHGTDVYDLKKYPYLDQSTVNIMFKKEDHLLYDESMFFSEDQKFDTLTIMKKEKIGFVEEAGYYYRRFGDSVFFTKTNPYYSFESIMSYNEELVQTYMQDGLLHPYIQALILSTLNYRITTDNLYPYFLEKEEYQASCNRIENLVNQISTEIIIGYPGMDLYHKFYIFKLQKKKAKITVNDQGYQIFIDGKEAYHNQYVTIAMNRFQIKNDKIDIMGYMHTPLHQYKKPNIYIEYQDLKEHWHTEEIPTFLSNCSYNKTEIKTNEFYGFRYLVDMKKVKTFRFYTMIDQHKIYGNYDFYKWVGFNKKLGRYRILRDGKMVVYEKKKREFKISTLTSKEKVMISLKNIKKYSMKNPKILYYRSLAKTHDTIWLYSDSKNVIDNAYEQFQHDFSVHDGIKRYYVYQGDIEKIGAKFTKEQQKYLVAYRSLKHKKLFLRASKILTSFSDFAVYSPFVKNFYYYNDLLHYDVIYLQHGILHAKLTTMYSREFNEIDKIVISSNFEKENLLKNYNYQEKDLLLCGMPRLVTQKQSPRQKKILFAPSWRKYLIGEFKNGERSLKEKDFLNSTFYQRINNFLSSKELQTLLQDHDYTLEFKLHPIFRGYKDLFTESDYVHISFDDVNISEYALFITDFSSFQFDFAWLKIPIIYFMPDLKEFKAGLHSYRELDLPYEKAFGPLCQTDQEMILEMQKAFANDFKVIDPYRKRMDQFFVVSKKPCAEIYKAVKKK